MLNGKASVVSQQSDFAPMFGDFNMPNLGKHSKTRATFKEVGGQGDYLVMQGENLKYEGGELVGGTVTSMTLFSAQDVKYASLTGVHFSAGKLPEYQSRWAANAAFEMMMGKDHVIGTKGTDTLNGYDGSIVIVGGKGDDFIFGDGGADILTGGTGNDRFSVYVGKGNDVITDFESPGTDLAKHDHILAEANSYTLRQKGADTVIEFDSVYSVTLAHF